MVRLFHISDLHFGAEDRAALGWFAQVVAEEKPCGIICTGDLTMRGTVREFNAAADYLGRLAAPVHIEPGNHDMPYYWEMGARLRHPFRRFGALRAKAHRALPLADVAVVGLSTVVPAQWRLNWSKGCVRETVLATALHELAHAGPQALKLVACHHPLRDADTHGSGSTRGGGRALAQLAAAGAHAVLSGHVHDPFDMMTQTPCGPIRMIGAGTLSERTRASRPSFNQLDWDGTLRVTARHHG
ncbi:MAG TPA: metallophosphoesterase [Novosphingobium sp.]|nr:metallophosphoesterase [Novosphingobium sp.]HZV09325.1 metallophosphoesterase [Novosphingobium sp.]